MTLTVADLDRIRYDQSPADPLTGQRELLGTDYDRLEAAAMRMLAIESAMGQLREHGYFIDSPDYREELHEVNILDLARSLGWPGLQSEGGKEQDG